MKRISDGMAVCWAWVKQAAKNGGPVLGLLGGCAMIAMGVWQVHAAAGCIVAGVELAGLSILSVRGEDK